MTVQPSACSADCGLARRLADQAGALLRSFRDGFAPPGSGNAHGVRALRDAADAAARERLEVGALRERVVLAGPAPAFATLFAPATMLRWDSTTPLGLPVLPEV